MKCSFVKVWFVAALLAVVVLAPSCASGRPPAGTYTASQQRTYNAVQVLQDLQAVSETAINLNHTTGAEHLSDRDTQRIRDYALSTGAALNAAGSGQSDLQAAQAGFQKLMTQLGDQSQSHPTLARVLAALQAAFNALQLPE